MSKIGRKAIPFSNVKIEIKDNKVLISGSKIKITHVLSDGLKANLNDKLISITLEKDTKENRVLWGLHRALLANEIKGIETGFEQIVKIVGLGFKAQSVGKKMVFTIGYTHKIEYEIPDGVTVDIDKTGQILTFKSHNKNMLGDVCDRVRSFRLPEPYKGTGIMKDNEVIVRKVGKTKSASGS
jgi:large subunit ribosomal protein L6